MRPLSQGDEAIVQRVLDRLEEIVAERKVLGRTDDMVANYIAGETEMGLVAWLHATATWPELAQKLEEGVNHG
jgi:hypothetical protein